MKNILSNGFKTVYNYEPTKFFSCGGRFEILGNHVDHNHGKCLAGTCSLAIYASVSKRDDNLVHAYSEGFGSFDVNLDNVKYQENEKGTSSALIRGIAYYLKEKNYQVGGLDIYMVSKVPGGAGVSSSAAFELLIAQIFNAMYNDGKIDRLLLCKAGQFAERNYYGKMCGLLDQIGVGFGGSTYIDFADIDNPVVEPLPINLNGYRFLIVDSGGSHAGLDHLYKAIPDGMYAVANMFNQNFLHDVDKNEVLKNKDKIIEKLGEGPYLKAIHFYEESERVEIARTAIKKDDIPTLMKLMDESRVSSTDNLQNMKVNTVEGSPLEACLLIKEVAGDNAGVKINGGGFAGSVIALIKESVYQDVVKAATNKYGKDHVYEIDIRKVGPEEL
ncbi:MAG: hypothetical protein HUJ59_05270 [Bacilli bacterium]|nr:hypothetical protein [Bacilli bacterium]